MAVACREMRAWRQMTGEELVLFFFRRELPLTVDLVAYSNTWPARTSRVPT